MSAILTGVKHAVRQVCAASDEEAQLIASVRT